MTTLVENRIENNPVDFSAENQKAKFSSARSKDSKVYRSERKKEAKFRYKFKVESLRAELLNLVDENEFLRQVVIESLPETVSESVLEECCVSHPDANADGKSSTKTLEVIIEELALVDKEVMDTEDD